MEIPKIITEVDSHVKQIVNYYLSLDEKKRQKAFSRMWDACETLELKGELLKYWATRPLDLEKSSTNRENKDSSDYIEKKTNHQVQPAKEKKKNLPQKQEKKNSKADESYNAFLLKIGNFLSQSHFITFKKDIEKKPTMDNVEYLFLIYSYKYKAKKLARFLLACFDHSLVAHPQKMQENIKQLLQKKEERTNKVRKELRQLVETRKSELKEEPAQLTYIPWETIEFCNGLVKFYPFRLNGALILKTRQPFVVNCRDSKASYNHIKQHFVNVLPQIRAYQKGADIVGLESELHLHDAIRILQRKYEFADWDSDDCAIPFSASYKSSSNVDQDKVLANLRKRKSSYFNYLIQRQLKGNRIVPCTELMVHSDGIGDSEDAFIFCLSSYSQDVIKLVFENVNEARATIVFEVTSVLAEKALRCLFDFMRSEECNKRQRLHYRKFNFQNYGVTRYYLVNHTTLGEWKYNL